MKIMLKVLVATVLSLAFVGSFSVVSMILDRTPPIEYLKAGALSPMVPQGGTIEVEYTVFRTRICDVSVKRWLYDSADERHSIPQFTTGLELFAGRETYRRSITIPESAALGPARYEVTLDYTCNPLHRILGPIRVVSPPITFSIGPGARIIVPPATGADG